MEQDSGMLSAYQSEPHVGLHDLVLLIHIDELYESQAERHLDLLGHVLHRPDELVVPAEEIPDQAFLLL